MSQFTRSIDSCDALSPRRLSIAGAGSTAVTSNPARASGIAVRPVLAPKSTIAAGGDTSWAHCIE